MAQATESVNRTNRSLRQPNPAVLAGVVAGPLFVILVVVQALSHDSFNMADHPLSLLALGEQGWIQTANFIACGAAFVASAVVEKRTTNRLTVWTTRLIVVSGTAFIVAGVARADPWQGYPVGADESTTWHGVIHNGAAAVAGLALLAATITTARHAKQNHNTSKAVISVAIGAIYFALSTIGSATSDFRIALAAGALIWCWTSGTLATTQRNPT